MNIDKILKDIDAAEKDDSIIARIHALSWKDIIELRDQFIALRVKTIRLEEALKEAAEALELAEEALKETEEEKSEEK